MQEMDKNSPDSTRSEGTYVSGNFTRFLIQDRDSTVEHFETPPNVIKHTVAKVEDAEQTMGQWIPRAPKQASNKGLIVVLDESERNSTAFKPFTNVQIDEVEQTAGAYQKEVSIIPYKKDVDVVCVVLPVHRQRFQSALYGYYTSSHASEVEQTADAYQEASGTILYRHGADGVRRALAFSRQLPQIGLYYNYASPRLDEAEQIKSWYRQEVSKISEVEQIVCKQKAKKIEFIVAVERIRRKISQQLSRIEFQLYNKHADWFFDFEHVGIRTFSQWSLNGYDYLFYRKR